jgi:F-type H+-transporting ATPase subunit delta
MAENTTVARPYAEAVFGIADAAGALGKWSETLANMAAVAAHAEVRAAIANPNLTAERVYGLFAALCGEGLEQPAQNLVRVLIENDRLVLLPEIHDIFEDLKNEREGVVEAQVSTAYPLDQGQLSALVADLERRFRRKIQARVTEDRELIGGIRVQVGDEVIDASVRGRLAAMATALRQ